VTCRCRHFKRESAPAGLILLPEQMLRLKPDMEALDGATVAGLPADHHVLLIKTRPDPLVEGAQALRPEPWITGRGTSPTRQLTDEPPAISNENGPSSPGRLEPQEAGWLPSKAQRRVMGR